MSADAVTPEPAETIRAALLFLSPGIAHEREQVTREALEALAVLEEQAALHAERVAVLEGREADLALRTDRLLNVLRDEEKTRREAERRLARAEEALRALYEEVEMAESVGICLRDRTPSLLAGEYLRGE